MLGLGQPKEFREREMRGERKDMKEDNAEKRERRGVKREEREEWVSL